MELFINYLRLISVLKRGDDLEQMEIKMIKKIQKGDIRAFEEMVKKYELIVYKIAFKSVGNEEDAKDVTQEAFLKIHKNISKFNFQSKFSTWLYRIVANTAIDFLRKKKTVYSIDQNIEGEEGEFKREIADENEMNQPEKNLEKNEIKLEVQSAILGLSIEHRTVLILREYQNLSYDEISNILGIKVGTVKSRIKRARENLKDKLLETSYLNNKKYEGRE